MNDIFGIILTSKRLVEGIDWSKGFWYSDKSTNRAWDVNPGLVGPPGAVRTA
jgi:hypothetical protein